PAPPGSPRRPNPRPPPPAPPGPGKWPPPGPPPPAPPAPAVFGATPPPPPQRDPPPDPVPSRPSDPRSYPPEVPDGPAWFGDVTADSGVDFTYRNGEEADQCTILESLGGGVAMIDYDGDGLLDLFFTDG